MNERKMLPALKQVNKPRESEIKAAIREYLNLRGIFNWPQWQGQFSVKGVPDLIAILPWGGRILGIEVKVPGWKFNPNSKHEREQAEFLESIRKSGGVAFFATSIDDVIKNLQYRNGTGGQE